MAAQGGTGDKILRVSMPFEKEKYATRRSKAIITQKRLASGSARDPWSTIHKVHSWAAQLKDGRVRSCAEIARREGITPARASQLWPLARITGKRMDDVLKASEDGRISLRRLLRIVRETDANGLSHGLKNDKRVTKWRRPCGSG